jgi:hypothetical protein
MPRGFKLIHSILRGLSTPGAARVLKAGAEYIAPRLGELLVNGTERLQQHGLGKIAEKIADFGLKGLAALPNTVDVVHGVANVGSAFLEDYKQSEPYNHEPNATFPDPNVAYEAMATLSGEKGYGRGSGLLVYGSDQPFKNLPATEKISVSGRTPYDKTIGKAPHPINTMITPAMSGKNTFGFLGWPGAAAELPNPRYTEAGQYFRKTGRGSNAPGPFPAYGIDSPKPHPNYSPIKQISTKGKPVMLKETAPRKKREKKMAIAI